MTEPERVDAAIVGAGQGGTPLAANLAARGWSVALFEREHLGGTCVNVGCTPTKAMVASARAAHVARTGGDLGVEAGPVEVDLARIVERKDDIVSSFRGGQQKRVDREGLTLLRGHARFAGPRRLEVVEGEDAGAAVTADRVVLNTGQRPLVPPIPGLEEVDYLTSTTVMELERVPRHLLVAGGGYVGCEFAQMFSRFGADVTVVQREDQLLAREDPDVAEAVREVFEAEGLEVLPGVEVAEVEADGDGVAARLETGDGTRTVEASHLLVATGRRPNTGELELETAGVELDDRGYVGTDDRFRTSAEGVWAIGDVTGRAPFTNVAYRDFQVLFENWIHDADLDAADRNVTYAVYTDPPVAGVGLNEREARRRGVEVEVATTPMSHVARAIETGETAGLIKVLADPESRRLLGASMVGISADEVIHVFTAVMDAGAPWDVLESGIYAHPAVAEALPVLVRKLEKSYA